jgi:hypothetical protein
MDILSLRFDACVPSREKERKLRVLILYLYLAELSVFLQKLEGIYSSEDAAICLANRVHN